MATITITDKLNVSLEANLAPSSSLAKYAAEIPKLLMSGASISQLKALTLADPAVTTLRPALNFAEPVNLGGGAVELTLAARAGVCFDIISRSAGVTELFSPDNYGDNIDIPPGTCYVGVGFMASAGPAIQTTSGSLTFGLDAKSGIAIESYRVFTAGVDAPTIVQALQESIGNFIIPADVEDVGAMASGVVVTVTGTGSLKFSGSANLLAIANPLATIALPSPAPVPSIIQTASVTVGASWEILGEFQIRVQKTGANRARLGWYRKHASDFKVTASAAAQVTAGTATVDLFPAVISAISANPNADLAAWEKAGVPPDQAIRIEDAVKAGINRKLEIAITAELGALSADEAAFLYEVDLDALSDSGKAALASALRGDVSFLSGADRLPAGITAVHDIWTRAKASHLSLRVNLLGIFNYSSVTELALSGTVTFTPSTGELVILDQASASRIDFDAVNFGPNEDKLRHLMAESLLITAAYRGTRTGIAAGGLSSSHVFFKIVDQAGRNDIRSFLAIASALGLGAGAIPDGSDFGRTTVTAEAAYDNTAARALFLDSNGAPRPHGDYEEAGRRALRFLVLPDANDAFRLLPATDDNLWKQMTDLGPPSFHQLLPPEQAQGVTPDYLAIQWWADSMCGTAAILRRMDQFFASHPTTPPTDPGFVSLRQELAAHLKDVASKAREQFGEPWGLVAMFLASGSGKGAFDIAGPQFSYSAGAPLAASSAKLGAA